MTRSADTTVGAPRATGSTRTVLPAQAVLLVAAVALVGFGGVGRAALCLALVPALWLPTALQHSTAVPFPRWLHVAYEVFILAGPFVGGALNVYTALPGWDKAVHAYSGLLVGWGAFFAVHASRIDRVLRFRVTAAIVLSVVVATAAVWEICEFASDSLLGTHAQHGNTDTMTDMISATVGGVAVLLTLQRTRRPRPLPAASATSSPSHRPPHWS
jgi:hypothetical protein